MFKKMSFLLYLIEVCILGGGEPEAALLGLKWEEAGQQPLSYLQVVAVKPGGGLGYITELVGKLLLHDGVQLGLIALQGIELHKDPDGG